MNINNIKDNEVIVKTSNISQIKIPMIQRDYVQGLEENNNKLDKFLDALYNIINSNNINDILSLDFIYGNINDDGIFEPIDGQQRLTTLALLNFYFFCKQENNIYENDEQNNTYLQNIFDYITYTTRQSAEKFCKILSSKDFIKHFKSNISNKQPSSIINEYNKYFKEYNDDTTIIAMIKALDKIHDKFKNLETLKYKNIDRISFNILTMNNFNLSDDLYIKMNGRGKQLSNFDNFKAEYFQWLENILKKEEKEINELIPDCILDNLDINPKNKLKTLKRKFDTDYIDIFWDFAFENSKNTEESPDPESLFFRFINRFVTGKLLSLLGDAKNENIFLKELIFKYFKQIKQTNQYKNKKEYNELDNETQNEIITFAEDLKAFYLTQDGYKTENNSISYSKFDFYEVILLQYNTNLISILHNLYNIKNNNQNFIDKISEYCKPEWEEKFNIFNNFKNYKTLLAYNTILSFLENSLSVEYIDGKIKHVSRLVWNIAEQYNIVTGIKKNSYKTIANIFKFLSEKSTNNNNIYDCFINSNKEHNQTGNLKIIIDDEIEKSRHILNGNALETNFRELEKLPYLKGSIGFLIPSNKDNTNIKKLDNEIIQYFKNIFNQKNSPLFKDIFNSDCKYNRCFIVLLLYKIYMSDKNQELYDKTFHSIEIRKLFIQNAVFRKYANETFNDILKNYTDNTSNDFIENLLSSIYEDLIKHNKDSIYEHFFLYNLTALLYLRDKRDKNEISIYNNHHINTKRYNYVMPNTRLTKKYTNKAANMTIIFEPNICNLIDYMLSQKDIHFINNQPKKFVCQNGIQPNDIQLTGYYNIIPKSNGNIVMYFKIYERTYTIWFIHHSLNQNKKEEIGITDEVVQPKKQLYIQCNNYNEFKEYISKIKNIIKILIDDNKLTLGDIYNISDLSSGFEKLNP